MLPVSNPRATASFRSQSAPVKASVKQFTLTTRSVSSTVDLSIIGGSPVRPYDRRFLHPYSVPRQTIIEAGARNTSQYIPNSFLSCNDETYIPSEHIPCVTSSTLNRREGLPSDTPISIVWSSAVQENDCTLMRWNSAPTVEDKSVQWDSIASAGKPNSIVWISLDRSSPFKIIWSESRPVYEDSKVIWGTQVCDTRTGILRSSFKLPDKVFNNPFPTDLPLPELEPEPDPGSSEFDAVFLHTYKIMNNITIKERDGPEINRDGISFSINLSLGDVSWSLTMNSQFDTTGLLNKIITIDINGEEWNFLIDRINSEERFGRRTWGMRGVSLTGFFKAPHDPISQGSEESESLVSNLAQGLVESQAIVNWTGVNWVIPPNTWSFSNKSRMQAINELANAGGLIVLPSKTTSNFEVRPYHLTYAWQWDTATVGISLNRIDFFNWNVTRETKIEHNGIYVTSQRFGTSSHVARLGSDGSTLLPEVTEELLTDVVANQSRGGQELSRSTPNIDVQGSIFLSDENTSIPVGQLIHVDGNPYHVESIAISCRSASARVDQQISLRAYDAE